MTTTPDTGSNDQPRSFGSKTRRFLLRLVLIVLGIFFMWILFVYNADYSEGTRAGMVIKLSKRGVVFKTWEGQLNLQTFGAVTANGNALNEVFSFSVESGSDSLYRQLEEASLSGERVSLHYVERYARLPWRGESTYFVTAVERSGRPAAPQQQPTEH